MQTGNETLVRLETNKGEIIVKLYNETPKHRDNFIKIVKDGVLDSTLFHRVIKDFMIQAGDPASKQAADTATLGEGDLGYTVPAEFVPALFHKRGALAAARTGDDINPEKASSACQFYIVTGRKFSESQLINMQNRMNEARLDTVFNQLAAPHRKEIYLMRKANDTQGLIALQDSLEAQARAIVDKEPALRFSAQQIKAYTTIGGTPHLDGNYTVFGEVVGGLDIVDDIQQVATGRNDRPKENVRILKATIVQ